VPATGEDGDIIHDPHGLDPGKFVQQTKRACAKYFGTAGPAFIRFLCDQGTTLELCQRVQQELEAAHALLVPKGAPAEVSRVVRRFALVLAAGWLACDAGVLPFARDEIERAVCLVLNRWLAVHGKGPMERALEQLRSFLLRNEARFRDTDDEHAVVRDLVGYRDKDRELFLLTTDGAQEALDGNSVPDVMRHLLKCRLLEVNEKDRLLSGHRIKGLNRVVRLYAVKASLLGEKKKGAADADSAEP
jgi:hypothetical protein